MSEDRAGRVAIKDRSTQDDVKQRVREAEKQAIIKVLGKTGGNKTRAAKLPGMDRS